MKNGNVDDDIGELDALFTATLVEMNSDFRKKIIKGYNEDPWYRRLIQQIDDNDKLGENAVSLPFIRGVISSTDADPYFQPRPEANRDVTSASSQGVTSASSESVADVESNKDLDTDSSSDSDLIYHIDWVSRRQRLCIPPSVVQEIMQLAHGNGYPGF